jgi:hypothetical protein
VCNDETGEHLELWRLGRIEGWDFVGEGRLGAGDGGVLSGTHALMGGMRFRNVDITVSVSRSRGFRP